MKLLATVVACGVLVSSEDARAASLITYTQSALGSTCQSDQVASGTASSTCGSFISGDGIDARASYGNLGLRSVVDGPTQSLGSADVAQDFWRGSAALFDTLYFSVNTGTVRIFTDLAATLIEQVTGSFGGSSLPFGRNNFQVNVNSTTVFRRFHEYTNVNGIAALTTTNDLGSTGKSFVDLAFTGGKLDLNVQLYSEARCGAQHTGNFFNKSGTCRLGVDAYNSIRLIGSTVFDSNGNEVTGGFVGSDSQFDYSAGVPPHSVSPIPVPASLPLLVFGIGGLGLMARRKRKAA